jgi:transcriptional regulator with XRE-family HTH domain
MARGFERTQAVLAKNVRELREARGLSQEMLALESEVDRTYVSQIERGMCNPSLRVLHQIASVLKVPMAELHKVPDRGK